jgi:RNA polymerase sigma factor (sigma-70 family)
MNGKMYVHSRVERPVLEGRFAELYRSELKYVWSSLRRLGTPAAELEDLCQEVFVRVFRALPDYDPDRPFRPWLFAVLFHTMLDYKKRDSRNPAGSTSADQDTVSRRSFPTRCSSARRSEEWFSRLSSPSSSIEGRSS